MNKELDAFIATEVMGWTEYHVLLYVDGNGNKMGHVAHYSPSTNLTQALEALEKWCKDRKVEEEEAEAIYAHHYHKDGSHVIDLWDGDDIDCAEEPFLRIPAKTLTELPLAICEKIKEQAE